MLVDQDQAHFDNEILYNEFFTLLFRYIFFKTQDYDIANDLTQTSFLKFLKNNKNIKDKQYASRLLFTIARNTLIDYWRVESKKKTVSLDEIVDVPTNELNQEENAILEEDKKLINDILRYLNDIEREVVLMRVSGDEDYETISSVLKISTTNARKIYSRAIQKVGVLFRSNNLF